MSFPETIAEDHKRWSCRIGFVLRCEEPAQSRLDAQGGEKIRGDQVETVELAAVPILQDGSAATDRDQFTEAGGLLFQIQIFGVG